MRSIVTDGAAWSKSLEETQRVAVWRSGNVVGRINEVTLRPARLVPGWVTVHGRAEHLSIAPSHAGQLSLLLYAGP